MLIRRANNEDAARMAEIMVDSWRRNFINIVPTRVLETMNVQSISKSLASAIKQTTVFVAENSDKVMGFVGFGKNRIEKCPHWESEIHAIHVDYNEKGKGIGSQILEEAFSELKNQNIKVVGLSVFQDNPANKFYRKHGGCLVGEQQKVIEGEVLLENLYEFNLS